MVGQFHLTRVAWKSGGLGGRDIKKHLFRISGDHVNGAFAYLHRRPSRMRLSLTEELARWRKARRALRDDGFQPLHGFLIRSAADVARAVIVIVREYAADFTIPLDARGPIVLILLLFLILLHLGHCLSLPPKAHELLDVFLIDRLAALFGLLQFLPQRLELLLDIFQSRVRWCWWQRPTEIGVYVAAVTPRVETCQYALPVRSYPDAHV